MGDMTKHVETTMRYDGPALRAHEMDVQDLAPALIALADIAKIANQKFNGDRASIRILVNADVEQKCFQLDLSLVQSWLDHATLLLGKDNIATARTIAEIIGFTGPPAGTLFWLYKKLYGNDEKPTVSFQQSDVKGQTIININGDRNTVSVPNFTAILAQDPNVLKNIKTVLAPLESSDYSDFSIRQNEKQIVEITRQEAQNIRANAVPLPSKTEDGEFISTIRAQVEIVTAQFKGSAQWGLWWTGRTRLMNIADLDWLSRYQSGNEPNAIPGAWLDIMLEISQPRDRKLPAAYTVREVKGVIPPENDQAGFFTDDA